MKINTLSHESADYPNSLRRLFHSPKQVYFQGVIRQNMPLIAVVGTRRPSSYGERAISSILLPLVRAGVGVISGLAFGIDKTAHLLALENNGYTLAVLASGLPDIYPRSHHGLAQQIIENGGGICSEYRRPHNIMKHHFLARNRIIAALADAVLIIEATERSGTFNTASHALELGKTVMAVPGSMFNRASVGANGLIKAGAELVTSADDVAEIINIPLEPVAAPQGSNAPEVNILKLLHAGPLDINTIQNQTHLPLREIQQTLSILEIKGQVRSHGAQMYGIR